MEKAGWGLFFGLGILLCGFLGLFLDSCLLAFLFFYDSKLRAFAFGEVAIHEGEADFIFEDAIYRDLANVDEVFIGEGFAQVVVIEDLFFFGNPVVDFDFMEAITPDRWLVGEVCGEEDDNGRGDVDNSWHHGVDEGEGDGSQEVGDLRLVEGLASESHQGEEGEDGETEASGNKGAGEENGEEEEVEGQEEEQHFMIMMPPVVDHVGIDEDGEKVEEGFVDEGPARLGEFGVALGLIDPMLEEAFFGRGSYGIEDFAPGIEHDVLFLGPIFEFDIVEDSVGVAIDALDSADVVLVVFEDDGGADFGGKFLESGVVLGLDPISFGIEVGAEFGSVDFKVGLPGTTGFLFPLWFFDIGVFFAEGFLDNFSDSQCGVAAEDGKGEMEKKCFHAR